VLTATDRPIKDCATDVWRLQSVELVIAVCRRLAMTTATAAVRYNLNLCVVCRNCKLVCETSYFFPLSKHVGGYISCLFVCVGMHQKEEYTEETYRPRRDCDRDIAGVCRRTVVRPVRRRAHGKHTTYCRRIQRKISVSYFPLCQCTRSRKTTKANYPNYFAFWGLKSDVKTIKQLIIVVKL